MKSSRLTVKGQVTIPKEMREAFGWKAQTPVQFEMLADGVKLTKLVKGGSRGAALVRNLRGRGNRRLSTDEIMGLTRGEEP
jgi:AbrB family looped-hinge helix DNA binding protein